ncbi:MAG: hypothetical protein ACJAQT_001524 [Akkermansiaceae bacterium]|jgi:hypothetical protein
MKLLILLLPVILPASAQLLVPDWRGDNEAAHAEWDVFTKAKFEPNSADVASDDATITCTTSSAFLTSSGNIYSFQAPTFFQLDDTTDFPIQNVFLQISALGSGVDVAGARLLATDQEGETVAIFPTFTFISSEEELTGENGGIGTTYGIQWDLQSTPVSGAYTILFNATESSLSLGAVSLDTSASFQKVSKPQALSVKPVGDTVVVTWFGGRVLQSSQSLVSGWSDVPGAEGVNTITLPRENQGAFFRLMQAIATE